MPLGETPHNGKLGLAVMLEADASMDVDDLIVPSRHSPVSLGLGRIPVGRDVAVFAPKDRQDLGAIVQQAMQIIRQRDVPDKRIPLTQERHMVRHKPFGRLRHQSRQRIGLDQRLDGGGIGLVKMGRRIHHQIPLQKRAAEPAALLLAVPKL